VNKIIIFAIDLILSIHPRFSTGGFSKCFAELFSRDVSHFSHYVHRCVDGAAVRRRDLWSVRLPAGALSSQLGQLSLPSLRGR